MKKSTDPEKGNIRNEDGSSWSVQKSIRTPGDWGGGETERENPSATQGLCQKGTTICLNISRLAAAGAVSSLRECDVELKKEGGFRRRGRSYRVTRYRVSRKRPICVLNRGLIIFPKYSKREKKKKDRGGEKIQGSVKRVRCKTDQPIRPTTRLTSWRRIHLGSQEGSHLEKGVRLQNP